MTIKLLVISTAPPNNRIMQDIARQSNGRVEIALHLGNKTAPFKLSSLARINAREGAEGHIMDGDFYTGVARELFEGAEYFQFRDSFSDHMYRKADSYYHKAHPLKDPQDYYDYYHVVADMLARKIRDAGVTHCLFFNIPHLGYDTVIYHLAKSMGLPTVVLTQSLFPNRFFSMYNAADNGGTRYLAGSPIYEMEKGSKPDLFYMQGIKQEREEGGRITAKAMLQLATFLLRKRPIQALNPVYLWKTLSRISKTYGAFPKWRDPFARFFHEDEFAYFDHLASYEDQEVDLTGDFVYFPLQLQPEMTTSALGERFRDQAYAIERLSEILPKGVRILVKENPKQGAYMRGPLFFHRLKRIPSVTFLPSWADTHALTANAKFVATITGTVGWEAIRTGKPALVFGNAWYRKFPGVFEFTDGLTYEDIVTAQFEHADLEKFVGSLIAQTHEGVVDRQYTKIVPDYDDGTNVTQVAKTILGLLEGTTPSTFHPAK